MTETYRLGIDIGSTTVKVAILDQDNHLIFADYRRHFANIQETLADLLEEAREAQDALEKVVKEIGARSVVITDNLAKVSIVGAGMMTHTNIASRMFSALASAGVNIDMISTSEITISVIVESDKCQDAVQALAKEFDLLENK